jgi:hypothetical protein
VRAAGNKSAVPTATASADPAPDETDAAPTSPTAKTATASAEPAAPVAAPKPTSKPTRSAAAPLHESIANARAEFQSPPEPAPMRDAAEQDPPSQFPAPLPATSDQAVAGQGGDQLSATQGSPIDQRWAESATSDPSATTDTSAKLRTAAQVAVAKGATPATAALSSPGTASTLIAALLAALALAGLIVGGIVKFSRRQPAVRYDPNSRRDIWAGVPKLPANDIAADRLDPSVDATWPVQPLEPPAWIRAARQLQTAVKDTEEKHTDEIEQLLSRAQNRPAA